MLVLSRKREEGIVIDGDIEIKVLEIEDGRVRLGITAPKSKEIVRMELYNKVEAENKAAVGKKGQLEEMKRILQKNDK